MRAWKEFFATKERQNPRFHVNGNFAIMEQHY
jgi:hypothetical protein